MITFVYDHEEGDWVAVYRDGLLIEQGHSVNARHLLERLGMEVEVITDGDAEQTGYQFPASLSLVKRADSQPEETT